jgi:cell division protease FtsH
LRARSPVTRSSAADRLLGLGKERKPVAPEETRTTFDDVAGIDEVKAEVGEIVDFLRDPDKYRQVGARAPKGVLLAGSPGTGKTLLARATAGEAGVPFFSANASEFIEMVVGVGAQRVRQLFAEARKVAPAIIFIDEIDSIGRSRAGSRSVGGHDEREQTLNQILTEMDGFDGNENVVVLAATNRPDVLDPALLRAGRFDRTITVSAPDQEGRLQILRVHTRHVPLGADADLRRVAAATPGLTGADLANLVNQAAFGAARRGSATVSSADLFEALERIQLGAARRVVMPPHERRRTAYHEAGHALLGILQPGADPVRKVSIIPRGRSLGATLSVPAGDRYGYDEQYLRGRIIGALGGMAAEEEVFGVVTTGAESDLQTSTSIARQMVGRWGMSERVGPVSVFPQDGDVRSAGVSDGMLDAVDAEIRRISDDCYAEARRLLRENRDRLDGIAERLLERETLDEAEIYVVASMPRPGATQPPVTVPA